MTSWKVELCYSLCGWTLMQSWAFSFLHLILFLSFFFFSFLLEYGCFTELCQFLLIVSKSAVHIHISPLFGFPSHLSHHKEHWVEFPVLYHRFSLVIYFICSSVYIYVNFNLPIHPTPPYPPSCPYICSLILCLYFCFANKIIHSIFLDSTYMC